MALKISDGDKTIATVLYNPCTGRHFVRQNGRRQQKFSIRYVIKDLDQAVKKKGRLPIDLNIAWTSVDGDGMCQWRSEELGIQIGQDCRVELLEVEAPANFIYKHRHGYVQPEPAEWDYIGVAPVHIDRDAKDRLPDQEVYTPEQQEWGDLRYDRLEEAAKVFAMAFREAKLTAFVCYSNLELRDIEHHAWGAESANNDDGRGCWARRLLLMDYGILKNDLPYLSDLCGMIPYVSKSGFDDWLGRSPRHQSAPAKKIDSSARILDSHQRLRNALTFLKISWPPKGSVSATQAAQEICRAVTQGKIEPVGWKIRTMRDVLDGKHTPSNRLAEVGDLQRWWQREQGLGNLPEK
jgi:hypothetical protein